MPALRLLDAAVFSNWWIASAAALLTAAATRALGLPPAPAVLALAFGGTLAVYTVDRLRDIERDRTTAPARTRFVERHRRALTLQAGAAAVLAVAGGGATGVAAVSIAAGVLGVALAHRRLKRVPFTKAGYLTLCWLAVTVGLPWAAAGEGAGSGVGWIAGILGGGLAGNAVASSLRDGEGGAARVGRRTALRAARAFALAGTVLALAAPPTARPLAAVPLATLAALAGYRSDERYGLAVLDGSLLLGATAALAL